MTVTKVQTLQAALDTANPNNFADACQQAKIGTMMVVNEETIAIPSGTTINLPTQSVLGLAAQSVQSVRVVTGTATGPRTVGDSLCTPTTTLCSLSLDGTTLTFENPITVAVVRWTPRPATPITNTFNSPAP